MRLCTAEVVVVVFPKVFSTHLVLLGENARGPRWVELTKALSFSLPEFWVYLMSGVDYFHLVIGFFPLWKVAHPQEAKLMKWAQTQEEAHSTLAGL